MNEDMQVAWLEISDMLGEPTREELDVFLRTWQRASQATRKALAEQPAQRTWVGLTRDEVETLSYQAEGNT
jgi:alkylhydroperoxidase family enzyme